MNKLLTATVLLLLSACASSSKNGYSVPENLSQLSASSSLACRFEKQMVKAQPTRSSNWYFWRDANHTETRDELSRQGEIWQLMANQQFFYTRLFFAEKTALDFFPADLAALGNAPVWTQLTTLVDTQQFGKGLVLVSQNKQNPQHPVEYYSGVLGGVKTDVTWLPALQLPAQLVKMLPEGQFTLTLKECATPEHLTVKPMSKTDLDNFRHIDYTDLGDMENDPTVKRIEQLMGGHHHDEH
jgi:hypothetical protein